MKKIIFFAALVIFLIIVGIVPLLVGISFKHQYLDFIAATNQQNQSQLKIDVINYQRGWFHSTATIRITPVIASPRLADRVPTLSPEQFAAIATMTLNQTISHGPVVMDNINNHPVIAMAAIENTLHSPDLEKLINNGVKPNGLLTMHSVFNFGGECENRIILPGFQYTAPGMGNVNWQGLTLDVWFHISHHNLIDQVKTKMKVGALSAKSEIEGWRMVFNLQPVTGRSDTVRQAIGLWTGNSELNIPQAALTDTDKTIFDLNNLTFKSGANLSGQNIYNFVSTLTLNKLIVPSLPIPTISAFNFKINFNNLNAKAIVNMANTVSTISKSNLTEDEREKQYLQANVQVITPATNIQVITASDTALGKFNINARVFWPASVPAPQTLEEVYTHTNAKIDIRMSIPLAKELVTISANNIAERSARQVAVSAPNSPPASAEVMPADQAAKNAFSQSVASFLRAGDISLPVSLQILGWWDQQLPPEVFAANIKTLGIKGSVQDEIIRIYTQLKQAPASAVQAAQPPTANEPNPQMKDQMQQLLAGNIMATIDQWLAQGYLSQDGNDYLISITREDGVIKVNGKDLPPDITNMSVPAPTAPPIPSTPLTSSPPPPSAPAAPPAAPQSQ